MNVPFICNIKEVNFFQSLQWLRGWTHSTAVVNELNDIKALYVKEKGRLRGITGAFKAGCMYLSTCINNITDHKMLLHFIYPM